MTNILTKGYSPQNLSFVKISILSERYVLGKLNLEVPKPSVENIDYDLLLKIIYNKINAPIICVRRKMFPVKRDDISYEREKWCFEDNSKEIDHLIRQIVMLSQLSIVTAGEEPLLSFDELMKHCPEKEISEAYFAASKVEQQEFRQRFYFFNVIIQDLT